MTPADLLMMWDKEETALLILAVAYCETDPGFREWAEAKGYLSPGESITRVPGLMQAMLAHVERK